MVNLWRSPKKVYLCIVMLVHLVTFYRGSLPLGYGRMFSLQIPIKNNMTFTESVRTCLKEKYTTFSGRASRSEYWWFTLAYMVSMFCVGLLFMMLAALLGLAGAASTQESMMVGAIIGSTLCVLVFLIPGIAVTVRRFHDCNLSGWVYVGIMFASVLCWVPGIISFIITLMEGTHGQNKYGPDPLDPDATDELNNAMGVSSASVEKINEDMGGDSIM